MFLRAREFSRVNAIADTGLLGGAAGNEDAYHAWAIEVAEQIAWPVLTCEAVLC